MKIENGRIAVTGASGFIGRHIVESLQRRGARVTAVVRNPEKARFLADSGAEIRVASLADEPALTAGFTGADAVVSNAALFRVLNTDWKRHFEDNVRGTENVMRAAAAAGVSRVVHVSSVAVYKGGIHGPTREDAPMLTESDLSPFNAYSVSKAVSERQAWELARDLNLQLTCCRPSSVFGAWDPNITPRIATALSAWILPIPYGMRVSPVYAGDVGEAVALMLEKDDSIGKSYNVTGAHDSSRKFFRAWRNAGGPWPRVPVPVCFPLTRLWDNSLAEHELGWTNRPLEDALRETFEREPPAARRR